MAFGSENKIVSPKMATTADGFFFYATGLRPCRIAIKAAVKEVEFILVEAALV
jgi:hypothetical protein